MGEKTDRNIDAMGKLLLLTQKGAIEWKSVSPSSVKGAGLEDIVTSSFVCKYQDKFLRIYRRKYKGPSSLSFLGGIWGNTEKQSELRWYSEVVLELIDENGSSLWQFPKGEILRDLLEAIKYKASGAHDLINSLLNEK